MRTLLLTFSALMVSSAALAQPVQGMLINACLSQEVNNPNGESACNCYASQMLAAATQFDISEMLQGRMTPNMNQMHPIAKANCGLQ
jgi:hypothetical protein